VALNSVESNLFPGESVEFNTRMSFVIFVRNLILFLIVWSILEGLSKNSLWRLFWIIPFILLIFASLRTFTRTVSSAFVVTDRRVLVSSGLMRRFSRDVLATNISGVTSHQGLFGRMLDYGNVTIRDAGGRNVVCPYAKHPSALKESINTLLESNKLTKGPAAYVQDVRIVGNDTAQSQPSRGVAADDTAQSFCTNCGTSLKTGSRFCPACGTQV